VNKGSKVGLEEQKDAESEAEEAQAEAPDAEEKAAEGRERGREGKTIDALTILLFIVNNLLQQLTDRVKEESDE
jgi:hypothetical protein